MTDKAFLDQSLGLMKQSLVPVEIRTITAGKLRRYHDVAWYRQLLHWQTLSRNIIDIGKTIVGICQSLWLIGFRRPDVVFAKGGYVSLPIGFAAHVWRVPLVIHDSDARPGLTNKILSRWATSIALGSPSEHRYNKKIPAVYVGVPIDEAYRPFDRAEQRRAKADIGVVDIDKPLVVVTGGGLGSRDINQALVTIGPELLEKGLGVYHVTGKSHADEVGAKAPRHADYQVVPFVYKDMVKVLGAADVVVSRASATFLQELAALGKPAIVIPSASLSDQVKNAEILENNQAAVVLSDHNIKEKPEALLNWLVKITTDNKIASSLSRKILAQSKPDAARNTAELIAKAVRK